MELAPEDDYAPGLGIFALFMIIIMLLLIGVGVVLAVAGFVILACLAVAGVLTTSMVTGLVAKNPKAGVQALFIQLGGLVGIPAGAFIAYVASKLGEMDFSALWMLIGGGAAGAVGGVVIAGLFNWTWGKGLRLVSKLLKKE